MWWIPSSFQGLDLLKQVSLLWEEAQQLQTEGLQKIESAVAGLEAEGLYRLLRGAVSHSPVFSTPPQPKNTAMAPTATISHLPPQGSDEAAPEASTPVVEGVESALEAHSSSVSKALEVAIPCHMAPLHLQLGASRGCTNAGLRGALRGCQPHMLLSVHMCTETTWGEAGMSLLHQDLSKLRCP